MLQLKFFLPEIFALRYNRDNIEFILLISHESAKTLFIKSYLIDNFFFLFFPRLILFIEFDF